MGIRIREVSGERHAGIATVRTLAHSDLLPCRHLAAEIEEDYQARTDEPPNSKFTPEELLELAHTLVPFLLSHNGEADAVDLLLELESIKSIIPFVDDNTYARVCLYMMSCVNLLVPPDDREFLKCAREIYRKHERYSQAMVCSLRLGDQEMIKEDLMTPKNECVMACARCP